MGRRRQGKARGFTLIELMGVIAIMGVLFILVMPSIRGYTIRAKVTEAMTALAQCRNQVYEVYASGNELPLADDSYGCEADHPTRYVDAVNTNADFSMKWAYGSCLRSVTPVVFPAFASSGGDGVATVEVQDGRSWTAVADNPWIAITTPSARTGTGTVAFKILPQSAGATATRKGALMVRCGTSAGQNIWVEQTPACQVRLQRAGDTPETFTAAGGVGMLRAEVGVPNCIWTFSSMSDWIHTAGISSWPGTPPADLAFVVTQNTTGASRTGQLRVGETIWQVTQRP